jgi:hypothetical protein
MLHLIIAALRKNQGRRKGWKEERVEEEGRKENQGRCCIRQDKGRKAAYEDQKNNEAGR